MPLEFVKKKNGFLYVVLFRVRFSIVRDSSHPPIAASMAGRGDESRREGSG